MIDAKMTFAQVDVAPAKRGKRMGRGGPRAKC